MLLKNYLSSQLYIYSIYQSALHLFHLPISFTFIPFTSLVYFIPFSSRVYIYSIYQSGLHLLQFPKFIYPSFNTSLILKKHCFFSLWIGSTMFSMFDRMQFVPKFVAHVSLWFHVSAFILSQNINLH